MNTLTLKAPAKINLYLDVAAKRPDGYHDIETVMQSISLFDTLTVRRQPENGGRSISVACSVDGLACDESNLCWKAAKVFFEHARIDVFDVFIRIEKVIPIAAGLAGGSTDAAAVFLALNELYGTGYDRETLCKMGAKVGADVPFCVRRGIASAAGIGDRFSTCAELYGCVFVVACAGEGVSTPLAYRKLDEMYDWNRRESSLSAFTDALAGGKLPVIAGKMYNIFESAVLPERPKAARLIGELRQGGALAGLVSGSGPSVFGLFDDRETAEKNVNMLAERGVRAFLCEPYYN